MKTLKILMVLVLGFGAVGCSKIPAAYRGEFQDKATGTKLTLGSSDGVMSFTGGRTLKAGAEELTYEAMLQGKGGIFVEPNSSNASIVDLKWVNPNLASKQVVQGFIWMESEVAIMFLDSKVKDKVAGLSFLHCTNGWLQLDEPSKMVHAGCPPNSDNYEMVRID